MASVCTQEAPGLEGKVGWSPAVLAAALIQAALLGPQVCFIFWTLCCCCLVAKLCPTSFVTPWTVAHQASLSMGSPRQEYWSGLQFFLWGIFPTQGSNSCLLHWQADSLPVNPQGSPSECLTQAQFT